MNHTPEEAGPYDANRQSGADHGNDLPTVEVSDKKSLLPASRTGERKIEHVRLCLNEEVGGVGVTTGFEHYRFRHNALPELNFDDISLQTTFLERELRTPLLISSMTGGSAATGAINARLAEAAQHRGWALGVGSVRAAVERSELTETFMYGTKHLIYRLSLILAPYSCPMVSGLRSVAGLWILLVRIFLCCISMVFKRSSNRKGILALLPYYRR